MIKNTHKFLRTGAVLLRMINSGICLTFQELNKQTSDLVLVAQCIQTFINTLTTITELKFIPRISPSSYDRWVIMT